MTMLWLGLVLAIALAVAAFLWVRRHRLKQGLREFHASPLSSMLAAGATTDRGVRLWGLCESTATGPLTLTVSDDDGEIGRHEVSLGPPEAGGAFALQYPEDVSGASPLASNRRYQAVVHSSDGAKLGTCAFVTAPASPDETPERFAIAAMSCNQPFDEYGRVSQAAKRLLSVLPDKLEAFDVKRVLLMGDQMYGDLPKYCSLTRREYFERVAPPGRASLTECSRQEVRALYQSRHRLFWKLSGFRDVQARFACHPILDDHEIVDNFGSSPEHATEKFARLRAGAIDAFYDFQAQRVVPGAVGGRPSAFYHAFQYGTVGVFVMDLRSERHADEQEITVYSDEQFVTLEQFLRDSDDRHVVIIVLSVPILHVPDWLAESGIAFASSDGDLADRWSNPKARKQRDRLLATLREHQKKHPKQRLVLVGGDIHVGVVGRLAWGEGIRDSYQLVSSAVSNASEFDVRRIIEALPKLEPIVGEGDAKFEGTLLEQRSDSSEISDQGSNPYGRLNSGLIEIERVDDSESTVRLLLIGSNDAEPTEAVIVFDSGRL